MLKLKLFLRRGEWIFVSSYIDVEQTFHIDIGIKKYIKYSR